MAAFEYLAITENGKKSTGIIEGDSPRRARHLLREKGLIPVSVELVNRRHHYKNYAHSTKLGVKELSLISRQLSVLIRSGLPLDEALQIVSEQIESKRSRRLIAELRTKVLEGQSLSQAIDNFPNTFTPIYRATVEAGELSGQLDEILERLSLHLESQEKIQKKLKLAMIYPVILTTLSFLVVIGLLIFVVPEIVGVFNDLDQRLPMLTQRLIELSIFIKNYNLELLAGIVLTFVFFKNLKKIEGIQLKLHKVLLKLPLVGKFSRSVNTANFTRTLSILTGSGVELMEAIRISGQVTPNLAISEAIKSAAKKVREGGELSKALSRSRLFPPITIHLIASGESSGKLAEMLEAAARNQEQEVQSFTETILAIFEPILILFMGGIVLIIVMAILTPIFEINQLVH